jgi:hypothetical protein
MGLTRNQVYSQGYRGFESLPLRHLGVLAEAIPTPGFCCRRHVGGSACDQHTHRLELRNLWVGGSSPRLRILDDRHCGSPRKRSSAGSRGRSGAAAPSAVVSVLGSGPREPGSLRAARRAETRLLDGAPHLRRLMLRQLRRHPIGALRSIVQQIRSGSRQSGADARRQRTPATTRRAGCPSAVARCTTTTLASASGDRRRRRERTPASREAHTRPSSSTRASVRSVACKGDAAPASST